MRPRSRFGIIALALAGLLASCNLPSAAGSPTPAGPGSTPGQAPSVTPTQLSATVPVNTTHTATQPPSETPLPSPTPAPAMFQLTEGDCCTGPSWAPDSLAVVYIDKPSPDEPSGLWRVDLEGGSPTFVTDKLGIFSPDGEYRIFPQGDVAIVERLEDSQRWTLANGGRPAAFSPDNLHLAWTAGQSGPPFDTPARDVWVSNSDGTEARAIFQTYGGGLVGWRTNGELLITGRTAPEDEYISLWKHSLVTGTSELVMLAPGRLRGISLSPGGRWLAHQVTFSEDPAEDGLWILDLESGDRLRLDVYGAYQWRSEGKLLAIPLEPGASAHRLLEIDALTGAARPLTDPAVTPLRIANGDWAVSPDGRYVAWVSAIDHNIWVVTLPE